MSLNDKVNLATGVQWQKGACYITLAHSNVADAEFRPLCG